MRFALLLLTGCTAAATTDTGSGCPNDLPASCPATVPDYNTEIAPIIEARCLTCHSPGGAGSAGHDFTTYQTVYNQQTEILSQVYGCRMPPEGATPLSSDERALLLDWLVCGAPGD